LGNLRQMEIKGEEQIAAPPAAVWTVLNNTDLLIHCIDGCEKLERVSDSQIDAVLKVKLGICSLRFHGTLLLSNMQPPFSYTIAGEGRGAISGLATGATDVRLEEFNNDGEIWTRLRYAMHGTAGGKLASLGTKLLSKTGSKIAARFFKRVAEEARKIA